jgi:hypothetical protein
VAAHDPPEPLDLDIDQQCIVCCAERFEKIACTGGLAEQIDQPQNGNKGGEGKESGLDGSEVVVPQQQNRHGKEAHDANTKVPHLVEVARHWPQYLFLLLRLARGRIP